MYVYDTIVISVSTFKLRALPFGIPSYRECCTYEHVSCGQQLTVCSLQCGVRSEEQTQNNCEFH
jgi:hypothetical protein